MKDNCYEEELQTIYTSVVNFKKKLLKFVYKFHKIERIIKEDNQLIEDMCKESRGIVMSSGEVLLSDEMMQNFKLRLLSMCQTEFKIWYGYFLSIDLFLYKMISFKGITKEDNEQVYILWQCWDGQLYNNLIQSEALNKFSEDIFSKKTNDIVKTLTDKLLKETSEVDSKYVKKLKSKYKEGKRYKNKSEKFEVDPKMQNEVVEIMTLPDKISTLEEPVKNKKVAPKIVYTEKIQELKEIIPEKVTNDETEVDQLNNENEEQTKEIIPFNSNQLKEENTPDEDIISSFSQKVDNSDEDSTKDIPDDNVKTKIKNQEEEKINAEINKNVESENRNNGNEESSKGDIENCDIQKNNKETEYSVDEKRMDIDDKSDVDQVNDSNLDDNEAFYHIKKDDKIFYDTSLRDDLDRKYITDDETIDYITSDEDFY